MLTKHDLDLMNVLQKSQGLKLSSRYIFLNTKKRASGVCCSRLQKSQTSPGKVMMNFSDTTFADGPRENLTDFQLFETGASNSSMA